MKGLVYRDGKFITILTDTDASTIYEVPAAKKKDPGKPGRKRKKVKPPKEL